MQSERDLLVQILDLVREIDRHRLYCDRGYNSLFDYAVQELRYSEGQASRRIQAMRLIKEIPEVEAKIASGELSLTNVQEAQSIFRDMQQSHPQRVVSAEEKREVLARVENKSTCEAQKGLIKMHPGATMPKERELVIADDTTEVRLLMSEALKVNLETVRSLLGPAGATMNYAELFDAMSDISTAALAAKRFGKKRTANASSVEEKVAAATEAKANIEVVAEVPTEHAILSALNVEPTSDNPRYIPKAVQYAVWQRDKGCCSALPAINAQVHKCSEKFLRNVQRKAREAPK